LDISGEKYIDIQNKTKQKKKKKALKKIKIKYVNGRPMKIEPLVSRTHYVCFVQFRPEVSEQASYIVIYISKIIFN
jgi:hypothetical protein